MAFTEGELMAWYNKLNPFGNTIEKTLNSDEGRLWTTYNSTVSGGTT